MYHFLQAIGAVLQSHGVWGYYTVTLAAYWDTRCNSQVDPSAVADTYEEKHAIHCAQLTTVELILHVWQMHQH